MSLHIEAILVLKAHLAVHFLLAVAITPTNLSTTSSLESTNENTRLYVSTREEQLYSTTELSYKVKQEISKMTLTPSSTNEISNSRQRIFWGPEIDRRHSGNVSVSPGNTASLKCRVVRLGNYTVSWIRHRDLHLLTAGRYTYTSDQRFKALHVSPTNDWVLLVTSVQPRDKGIYECQIGTTPPRGHFVFLNVFEPVTVILGSKDVHINIGSTLNLTCLVMHHAKPPDVRWLHEGKVIHYASDRGGISLVTESNEATKSTLLIQKASVSDSGKYSCQPIEGGEPAAVIVHVLNGEHRAFMHSRGDRTQPMKAALFIFLYFLLKTLKLIN